MDNSVKRRIHWSLMETFQSSLPNFRFPKQDEYVLYVCYSSQCPVHFNKGMRDQCKRNVHC
jgi:hypothetical protein